jgi:hypothetical protein
MRRALLLAVAAAVILPFPARAQTKPNFSGTWTLDASKSDAPMGRRGGAPASSEPIVVTQTANQLTIKRGEQSLVYKLDGSESTNQMPTRGGTQEIKSKARWDGSKLVIETTRDFQGMSITQKEMRSLSADGKEMVVEQSVQTPQGERTTKQVYTKS